jgi:hypothetical protein
MNVFRCRVKRALHASVRPTRRSVAAMRTRSSLSRLWHLRGIGWWRWDERLRRPERSVSPCSGGLHPGRSRTRAGTVVQARRRYSCEPIRPAGAGRWPAVRDAGMRAASQVADGEAFSVEGISTFATTELAYEVEIHRFRARLSGAGESAPLSLRVTTIDRLEENSWRVARRHADAISGERSDEIFNGWGYRGWRVSPVLAMGRR